MGKIPRYSEIVQGLTEVVRNGSLSRGEQVPAISELSKRYNVSHVTVLRALRELSETGVLVRKPGRGYFASDLAGEQATLAIGCLFRNLWPRIYDNYTNEMFMGIQREAALRRLNLLLAPAAGDVIQREAPEISTEVLMAVRRMNTQVSGFLFDARVDDATVSAVQASTGKPVVVIQRLSHLPIHSVTPEIRDVSSCMLTLLLKMNYRNFLFIEFGYDIFEQNELKEAWGKFRSQLPSGCQSLVIKDTCRMLPENFEKEVKSSICRLAGGRLAVICCDDGTARTVIDIAEAEGLAVPDRLGVVGFYGLLKSVISSPLLTTLKVDTFRLGATALGLLADVINEVSTTPPGVHYIKTEFIPGETI